MRSSTPELTMQQQESSHLKSLSGSAQIEHLYKKKGDQYLAQISRLLPGYPIVTYKKYGQSEIQRSPNHPLTYAASQRTSENVSMTTDRVLCGAQKRNLQDY